jgi:hypothetical protein
MSPENRNCSRLAVVTERGVFLVGFGADLPAVTARIGAPDPLVKSRLPADIDPRIDLLG